MKKLLTTAAVVAAIAVIAFSQRATIAAKVLEIGLERTMSADPIGALDDGLHLALCGAGGPLPAPRASGPCAAVIAGKQLFVVDVGTDSPRNLGRMGYPIGDVEAVFLTHFHSDHIDGLGELSTLRWAAGDNETPLPVYGPTGVKRIVAGFNMAYQQDTIYRHAHHGDLVAPMKSAGMRAMPFRKPADGELTVVYRNGDLTIESFAVNHSPVEPAVAYRFTYKDRSLVVTGDTTKQESILKFSQGVDLLVHEALAPNIVGMMNDAARKTGNAIMEKVTHDIPDYHASPVEAAETARDAGVGHLLYYHIVPPIIVPGQAALWLNGADDIFPDYTIGEDGVTFSMPANSDEINKIKDGL